ncbi:peptidase inhibitor family I36 protein [Streptomyces sp. NPDC088387]|uniref:peptidase inhibitor family I36 protein n=1 Tax=Streptomyces sp. NPDC088387 TaxID=3365859 RepID=UPI003817354A
MTTFSATAKRRAALFLGAATLATSAGLGAAAPASAAASDCNGYQLCLFTDANYGGTLIRWNYLPAGGTLPSDHDSVSSIVNNSGSNICFYEHPGYGGLKFTVGPWQKWATVPDWINDKISSLTPC